jgi:hypothetical protein
MRIFLAYVLGALVAITTPACAEYIPYRDKSGGDVQPFVLFCSTGVGYAAAACGGPTTPMFVLSMPFVRSGTGDPIIFDGVTTTAKQFAITKPADATSYRFLNPCNVDVRIRRVSSMTETVTLRTGTRFFARTAETLGTSNPTFVSIIATATPTGDCSPELQYGNGG